MTRMKMAALALAAGVTIAAAPALMSWAADPELQTAQAQTPANPGAQPPSDQQGPGGMRGMMGRDGMGPMGRHWMREAMNRSPRRRHCVYRGQAKPDGAAEAAVGQAECADSGKRRQGAPDLRRPSERGR